MNKMYQYLKEHNYISNDENKDPFKQQELSKERAEAIVCKYTSLLEEMEEKNKKNEETINKAIEHLDLFISDTNLNKYDTLKILMRTKMILKEVDEEVE